MSSKDNNEVAVEKIADNGAETKCEIKGTKRPAEVSFQTFDTVRHVV